MRTTTRYVAKVSRVREVSLLGSADLAFWRERLKTEDLVPAEREGMAQVRENILWGFDRSRRMSG